ncbi:MAG TPA: serine/threonine-protein kinase [Thermoanaerobaculia bacterium]|nr:serine/threonine-protein kinase [Thermoanaerobaculia bacterium]
MADERSADDAVRDHSEETLTHERTAAETPENSGPSGRFTPGTILAARYRIVAPLGSGGVGDVYRAEDMKLGQTVALKFVNPRIAHERNLLERIVTEVRIGRQVAHPNLCRIYDMGEVDNQHFITMEYVDGENLASLLRRVGRLPEDRALEVAREICAGLAAAHDRGVVHRDMKPSNIMIDGRGRARITDFGLAINPGEITAESFAGTPAYMAPEQFEGSEATEQSDIYSLGLVLYELFTGQRLYSGSVFDISSAHSRPKRPPSAIVRGLSPAIERVILHCLQELPADRPESVRNVLAELPGGDALRHAIEAGETPSPRAVAATERVGEIPLRWAWMALILMALLIAAIGIISRYSILYRQVPLSMSPDVLSQRAREIITTAGYQPRRAGSRRWFGNDIDTLKYTSASTPLADRAAALHRISPLRFGYRESPAPLVPQGRGAIVTASDPPLSASGMVMVLLDSKGQLVQFVRVPEPSAATGSERVDWQPFFEYAGLDPTQFQVTATPWVSPVDHQDKRSWTGTLRGTPPVAIDVHAASMSGKPVFFRTTLRPPDASHASAGKAKPAAATATATEEFTGVAGFAAIFLSAVLLAAFVARRNLRLGRGDRSAARKLALIVFASLTIAGLLSADHAPDPAGEWGLLVGIAGNALYHAGAMWLFYIAAEPYVRRRQPELLISWTRVLRGYFRDPLVGRDVLIGCLLGAVLNLLYAHLLVVVPALLRMTPPLPDHSFPEKLGGGLWPLVSLASLLGSVPRDCVLALFLYSALRSLVRNKAVAAIIVVLISTIPHMGRDVASGAEAPFVIAAAVVFMFALARVGLLSGMVTLFVASWLAKSLFVFDPRSWLFGPSLFYLLLTAAIALYGFRYSLGGQPVLGRLRVAE